MNSPCKTTVISAEELKAGATRKEESPFDYIIVGSGAGGGPLACRLAQGKKKVLLIEAGPDPRIAAEVYDAPLFHGAATEHPDLSWDFSVRHYDNDQQQRRDHKYDPKRDPSSPESKVDHPSDNPSDKGGIFYPRSSGIGGCTSHHAMIVVRPNDRDWDEIADLTNDDSWRASNMQPYFAKMENCLYLDEYRGFLVKLFGWFYKLWLALMQFINPKSVLDQGGHGRKGWQPTNFIAPELIKKIIKTDNEFTTVLIKSAFKVIKKNSGLTAALKRFLIQLGFVRAFDPNDVRTREANEGGGVFLIPTGIGNDTIQDENGVSLKGRRTGVREFIRKTQEEFKERTRKVRTKNTGTGPEEYEEEIRDYLVVEENFHVERVLFSDPSQKGTPRVIGIIGTKGSHLYKASPKSPGKREGQLTYYVRHEKREKEGGEIDLTPKGEVILSGGSFNTPQLLMLSGIGDREELARFKIETRVHLPGVGRNLQDRYEVGVINELQNDLETLDTLSFDPNSPRDKLLKEWKEKKEGLYTSNGGTVTILQRSEAADGPEWDLFTFGAPAAFRGYYWGWSKELLRPVKGAANDQRNLWTWVVLKAYTRNNGGQVRLRSDNPFDTPSICFHSFEEGGIKDWNKDVQAMVEAIELMREINAVSGSPFGIELQPAGYLKQANTKLKPGEKEWTLRDWIVNEAWGHHACGTCRMGSDPWRKNAAELNDKEAVLDSHFKVHGVEGLRVVDASVFPKIPGYFILAPIFMVSEKAADTILREGEDASYPSVVREIEQDALRTRRKAAHVNSKNKQILPGEQPPDSAEVKLPLENVVGLALSGGGVRSSTFSLGVLQALAEKGILRHVDFLSTVSGGCFTGSFLGRLFARRLVTSAGDPVGRIQDLLKDNRSSPMRWLRTQANYLFSSGVDDWLMGLGVYFRNVFAIHFVIGMLLLVVFGMLAGIGNSSLYQKFAPLPPTLPEKLPLLLSVWWWIPLLFFVVAVVPMKLGFWLAPLRGSYRAHPPNAFAAWVILLIGACALLALPFNLRWTILPLVILLLAWFWQEISRRRLLEDNIKELKLEGVMARNRLTRGLGEALVILVLLIGWVVLDTFARTIAGPKPLTRIIVVLAALAPALPILRSWALKAIKKFSPGPSFMMQLIGLILGLALLFLVNVIAHTLFRVLDWRWAWGGVVIALLASLALGRAFNFLNLSSLHAAYAARITRTFLGASNEARTQNSTNIASDVSIAHADDDMQHQDYRPEKFGGPLHLISVCVNETVDHASQREIRERKGVLMTIGTFGVSIGRRYFAQWSKQTDMPRWLRLRRWLQGLDRGDRVPPSLQAIRLNEDPGTFHPLGRQDEKPAVVEALTLGEWTAISGAAFSTGRGRGSKPLEALLMGILNVRLGYWWDSGVRATERPGRFPANIWRRIKEIPGQLFETQHLLFAEWRARFDGPSHEFWNLSDGGHLDNSAIYELIRRRVGFIICTDATRDLDYTFEDFSNMVRNVRVDLGVEVEWQKPYTADLPDLIKNRINLKKVGTPEEILGNKAHGGIGKKHAAFALVKYPDGKRATLLLLKASLTPDDPLDVAQYAKSQPDFPQDSTAEQIYDDERWESYRHLGFKMACELFTPENQVKI